MLQMMMHQWWLKLKPWCSISRKKQNRWVLLLKCRKKEQVQKLRRGRTLWMLMLILLASQHCLLGKGSLMFLMSTAVGHLLWLTELTSHFHDLLVVFHLACKIVFSAHFTIYVVAIDISNVLQKMVGSWNTVFYS